MPNARAAAHRRLLAIATTAAAIVLALPAPALADAPDSGHTAWMLVATALVLFMTLPGLALFYGGLVRAKNALSVLSQCFAIAALVSVLWAVGLYSLVFADGGAAQPVIGGLGKAFLAGVTADAVVGSIPETVFQMFQLTFAIITPALVIGAFAERIRFAAVLVFTALWAILVYAPAAHWVWGGGWLAALGTVDFAGGIVVHVTAGASALVAAILTGRRIGFPEHPLPPHATLLTATGAGMLWVGWFGFNAGSALQASGGAGMAMTVTHLSAAMAALTWMSIEWLRYGKPSLVGIVTGMVAGLATVTPAAGSVGPVGALILGLAGGLLCFAVTHMLKRRWRIDDSLDVFAVHGVGGALGSLLLAPLADPGLGGAGLAAGATWSGQLAVQALAVVAVGVWSAGISWALLKAIDATLGLRVPRDEEIEGLDVITHGERAYEL